MNRDWIRVWPVVVLSAALAAMGADPGCGSNSGDVGRTGASGDGVSGGSSSGQTTGSVGATGTANGSSSGQTVGTTGGAGTSGTDTTGATGSAGTGSPGASTGAGGPVPPPADPSRTLLLDGWRIQSSAKVTDAGSVLATAGYQDGQWSAARVPSTVLAALVDDGVYKDPYAGDNLRNIPASNFHELVVVPA